VRFIFLTLFNGAIMLIQIAVICKALNRLFNQIAIRHGMADDHGRAPHPLEDVRDTARCLALAAARANAGAAKGLKMMMINEMLIPERKS
jgi:hypothetical protein